MTQMPPQLLVWTCIGASLGAMGFMSALASCTTFALPPLFDLMPTTGMSPEQEVVYRQFLYSSVRWAPLSVIIGFFKLPLGLGLMIGSGYSLAGSAGGDTWLRRAYRYGLFFEPVGMVIAITIGALTIYSIDMGSFMATFGAGTQGAPPPQFETMMNGIMWGAMALQFAVAGVWTLAKMGFYGWGLRLLESEEAQTFYRELIATD